MDCDSYLVVLAVLGSVRFRNSLRVVSSTMGIILGIPFLRHFDPRISWREGTLTICRGDREWVIPMCAVDNAAQSAIGWPVLAGTAEVSENTLEAISALAEEVPFEVRVGAQLPLGSPVSSAPV